MTRLLPVLIEARIELIEQPFKIGEEYLLDTFQSPIPLAGGENMRGDEEFAAAVSSGAFKVIQPDLGKWGGFSGCLPVGRKAIDAGRMFCPH